MQSFFIGTGAVVASALPYILTNWFGMEAESEEITDAVKWSFYIGAVVFISAVMWTVFSTKEYTPDELKSFEEGDEKIDTAQKIVSAPAKFNRIGIVFLVLGILLSSVFFVLEYQKELYILSLGLLAFGLIELIAGRMQIRGSKNGFVEVLSDFNTMPATMVQLAFVQFFSWFALFAMWIYSTSGVSSHIYQMKVNQADILKFELALSSISNDTSVVATKDIAKELDQLKSKVVKEKEAALSLKIVKFFIQHKQLVDTETIKKVQFIDSEYNKGANWVGVCFSVYNGAAAILAFFLMFLARITNRKITHSISLLIGGISLASIYLISDPAYLVIPFLGIGLAWASILAMPYAILTGSLPAEKMGTYMGIFNFFIVIPQILAASLLGFFVKKLFDGEAIYALILGGLSMIIASILVVFVKDKD
jgi:maltose/moltooligosaccharide transporter